MGMLFGNWEQKEDVQTVCAFLQKEEKFCFLSEKWLYDRVYYSQFHFLSKIFKMPLSSIEI